MGNFYTNVMVRGPRRQQVVKALKALRQEAFVSPTVDGVTVVYEAAPEGPEDFLTHPLGAGLSDRLNCPALVVVNQDDDFLLCLLFEQGQLQANYAWSCGSYFEVPPLLSGPSTFAKVLCEAFDVPQELRGVRSLLRRLQRAPNADSERERTLRKLQAMVRLARRNEAVRETVRNDLRQTAEEAERLGDRDLHDRLTAMLERLDEPPAEDDADDEKLPHDALELHARLVRELGIGELAVGMSYDDLAGGQTLYGKPEDFIRVPRAAKK